MQQMNTKSKILETATNLFYTQGYNNTGINQIIKEANVAKASLYYHFAKKEDLCVAYLKLRNENWSISFQEFIKNRGDKVIAAFDFLKLDNEKSSFRGCSFLNILPETEPNNIVIFEQLQNHKKELLSFFEEQIKDSDLAYTIYSLFENAIIESQLYKNQDPVDRLKKISKNLLS